jgi:hypothetical protein
MTDKDFHKIQDWANVGGGLIPVSDNAIELLEQSHKGEVFSFIEVTNRDLKFHRCYFSLLNFIWSYMPPQFKRKITEDKFYVWLKHLKGQYNVIYTFSDGSSLIEYDSISFGRMSQKTFENYIREQLPYIYENVLGKYFEGEMLNGIIETIEDEYKKFLAKL